jgi:GT2 family glycosyltransferase
MHLILRRFFSISKLNLNINSKYELKEKGDVNYLTPVVLGSFMLFRNSALKEIGLFDENFFLYPEDIDISRRMFEKFDNIIFTEKKFIHHHTRESYKNIKLLFIHIKEMITYFNKWGWVTDNNRKKSNQRALNTNIIDNKL